MNRQGVVKGDDGHFYIPESRRPDGSIRPAIRVKEGYIPPEEQKLYRAPGRKTADKPKVNLFEYLVPPEKLEEKSTNEKKSKKKNKVKFDKAPEKLDKPDPVISEDPNHKLRTERKRLRQIIGIEIKKNNGQILNNDQKLKLSRKPEVENLISSLEQKLKI